MSRNPHRQATESCYPETILRVARKKNLPAPIGVNCLDCDNRRCQFFQPLETYTAETPFSFLRLLQEAGV